MHQQVNEETIDLTQRYDPRRNQKQMAFHRAGETYKLFGGAMGGGKTATLINEGNQLNLDYPGNFGLIMRRTLPSFRNTVLPQLEKFIDRRLVASWNKSEKLITYINGSRILYGGVGDDPDDWEKFMSGEYGWIALDQAEEFSEKEFKMLGTRLRLRLPKIRYFFLLSCNPTLGWIKERFIEQNLPDYVFVPSLPTDNLANLPEDYLPRMEDLLDENLQRALLRGDWSAVGDPNSVFSYLKIQESMNRRVDQLVPVSLGVDVARSGDDETVIVVKEGLRVRIHHRAQGHDTMRTVGEIWTCIRDYVIPTYGKELKVIKIKVDADGLGAGVVDRLVEQKEEKEKQLASEFKIIEIHGSAKARDAVKFKNARAENHWALRQMLDDIKLPKEKDLITQLMSLKYEIDSDGRIKIIPKIKIKKDLGSSPDIAEAVIYAFAEPTEEKGVFLGFSKNDFY